MFPYFVLEFLPRSILYWVCSKLTIKTQKDLSWNIFAVEILLLDL